MCMKKKKQLLCTLFLSLPLPCSLSLPLWFSCSVSRVKENPVIIFIDNYQSPTQTGGAGFWHKSTCYHSLMYFLTINAWSTVFWTYWNGSTGYLTVWVGLGLGFWFNIEFVSEWQKLCTHLWLYMPDVIFFILNMNMSFLTMYGMTLHLNWSPKDLKLLNYFTYQTTM